MPKMAMLKIKFVLQQQVLNSVGNVAERSKLIKLNITQVQKTYSIPSQALWYTLFILKYFTNVWIKQTLL